MNLLILEDEEPAAIRLKNLITEVLPESTVLDVLVSVKSAVQWLKANPAPDLILQDINLADGNSFEIFSQVNVDSPIIFVTAYDEYAMQAFKVNSVEYLLKPIKKEELISAIEKYRRFHQPPKQNPDLKQLVETLKDQHETYKKRFLIRFGEHIKMIDVNDIAYFYTEEKINFLKTVDDRSYHVDFNLDKLESMLDPEKFFRINRQFIISIGSIKEMFSFSKSRVKVVLSPPINMDTIVSTERSPHFKEWLSGSK